jgi:alpha-ketoglutarate-dependent taurine dioxygenase
LPSNKEHCFLVCVTQVSFIELIGRIMQNYLIFEGKRFHYLWLRDNCQCSECRHHSGQRLQETWHLNPGVSATQSKSDIQTDSLEVTWQDGHVSLYPRSFLELHSYDAVEAVANPVKLWAAKQLANLASYDYQQVLIDPKLKLQWLQDVTIYGVAKLHNVPIDPGTILKVVDQFGYVRNTNYGDLFEVVSVEQAENLAFTPIPLSLHTDNPYRNPVPSLQLLHCLVKADLGGVSALADGFYGAKILQKQNPEAFALLSTYKVKFRYASDDAILEHTACMIEVDSKSEVEAIRVNNRSCAPLNIPFDLMTSFYDAYQSFMRILQSDECKMRLTLETGELIVFDNQRVLHGREIQAVGNRHLQGCYADRDGLRSTAALLKTKLQ